MRSLKLLGLALGASFALSASAYAQDITIGIAGPMTGGEANFGRQMRNGAEMAVADVNVTGGVLGRKLVESDRDMPFAAIPLEQVLNVTERARKLRLVMLDSCRNNPFAARMKRTAEITARSTVSRGFTRVEPNAGTLVVYAAKDGETASDGDGSNSPFTTALLKNLRVPGIEVRRLFDYVRDDVQEMTRKQQLPYTYGSVPGREDFYFLR